MSGDTQTVTTASEIIAVSVQHCIEHIENARCGGKSGNYIS
jgi:hypothetical protein